MKRKWSIALVLFALPFAALLLPSCRKVEGSGRSQLVLTSASQEDKLGATAYEEILSNEKPCTDEATNEMVRRVGERLAACAPDRGFKYEFRVLESEQVNAFCLPGGKVAVYTGILAYCENEAGLAAVMGHEIAHAIARHGGERMSQGILVQGVTTGLAASLEAYGVQPTTKNVAMAAFGAGSQIGVLLPYSRTHELEADYLGLLYMSKAGYDPKEAPAFWQRFAKLGGGTPNFLSTHPASTDRAKQLNDKQPEALKLYAASPKFGAGEMVPAKYRAAGK